MLQVAERRAAETATSEAVHARLRQMPQAPTSAQVAQQAKQGRSRVSRSAPAAATSASTSRRASGARISPAISCASACRRTGSRCGSGNTVTFAPDGGYVRAQNGQSAFTHGIEIGVTRGNGSNGTNLQQQTEQLLQGFAQSNPQLRRQGGYSRTSVGGRQGLTTTLSNVSEVTGEPEAVNVSTVQLRDGSVLFLIGVAPTDEARTYLTTFNRIRQNVQLTDNR